MVTADTIELGEECDTKSAAKSADTAEIPRTQLERFKKFSANSESFVFDIETGPLSLDEIKAIAPAFEPPKHPGEFDANSVKYGNTKDPAKRGVILQAAREKHSSLVENYELNVATAEEEYWAEVIGKAALSPLTGSVLAIGVCFVDGDKDLLLECHGSEEGMLSEFWEEYYQPATRGCHSIVGHNIKEFDLPFLVRRSWMLGVDIPAGIVDSNWRYWHRCFVDTREVWNCCTRGGGNVPASLDVVARALGLPGKMEGVTGADFARLFADEATRERAIEYLMIDLDVTLGVARRLGVLV